MWFHSLRRWDEWLSVRGQSASTRRQYRYYVLRFWADTMLEPMAVVEDDVISYVASLPSRGAMRGQMLRALRSFYSWAEDKEIAVNPAKRLPIPRGKLAPAPSLEDEELTRLVLAAANRSPKRAWIILLLYATGGRAESVVQAMAEDAKGGRLYFREAKGDRSYSVPLGRIGREAVKELAAYGTRTLIGVGYGRLYEIVRAAGWEAGLHVWPHLIRHTYATNVARRTDPRTWMDLMGHADLSQYKRYVAVDDERAREAVEDL